MTSSRAPVALLLVLACATGCASASGSVSAGPSASELAGVEADVDVAQEVRPYVLQRGDHVDVRGFGATELDVELVIRPDGRISVPLLDDVVAAGRTPDELADELARGLAQHFTDPEVTVIVVEFAKHNVFVGGEVAKPGLIALRHRMTSLKAVLEAGGFLDSAQLTNLVILRDAGGKPEVIQLDVKQILEGESLDRMLRPFDVVFVPKSKIARVNLWVEQYIKGVLPVNLQGTVNYAYIAGVN